MVPTATHRLILASGSRYRRELLSRLRIPFEVIPADIDEQPLEGEEPLTLASRLAREKAWHVARLVPEAIVIGSDQVAICEGRILGKPGNFEVALEQLRHARSRLIQFQTGVCVVHKAANIELEDVATVRVRMRDVPDRQLAHYLKLEEPFDCAGSAKSEGLGIALLDTVESDDPTALVGLPLSRLVRMLGQAGLDVLDCAS